MRLHILSDLHLEASGIDLPVVDADVLVLAGDIATNFDRLAEFLDRKCDPGTPKILVPGNHEFECRVFEDVEHQILEATRDIPNFHLLNNRSVVIGGVKFIGSTLWSNLGCWGPARQAQSFEVGERIVASHHVRKQTRAGHTAWSASDMTAAFERSHAFLKHELHTPHDGARVVVSHFAPLRDSNSAEHEHELSAAFWVNQLPELLGFSELWVHGHVHHSCDYPYEGTRVICNPRGRSITYGLSENVKFDPGLVVDI